MVKALRQKGVDWVYVAHRRDQWRAILNTVMNLKFSEKWAERLLASEGLCSTKLVSSAVWTQHFMYGMSADWPAVYWLPCKRTTCSISHNASSVGRPIEPRTGRSFGVRFDCFCECECVCSFVWEGFYMKRWAWNVLDVSMDLWRSITTPPQPIVPAEGIAPTT
jgi:hypothetical protein